MCNKKFKLQKAATGVRTPVYIYRFGKVTIVFDTSGFIETICTSETALGVMSVSRVPCIRKEKEELIYISNSFVFNQ
jgi:hypothetical protein